MSTFNTHGITEIITDTSYGGSARILIRKLSFDETNVVNFLELPSNIREALESWISNE